ncbi:receptor-like protein 6 [Cornus florida]|uniref:receptor-like protein 6 n=1 Tax=Cornus florida TaxID=4283 RepID=UPI00289BA21D|nr:receptor-like protein 6 [Cornus florida]
MGGSSPILFLHYLLFFLLIITTSHYFMLVHSFPSLHQQNPLYHHNDSSALVHFNQSLSIWEFASGDASAYPKVASWNTSNSDCCSWDGVTCDDETGRVIGLDLSSSFLFCFINTNNTLFRLVHLRRLNLADNDFNESQIPSAVGLFSRLTYLNLSYSVFAGQIPSEISNLTKLTSLDLLRNSVELRKPGLTSLVKNVTNLKELYLNEVNIFSTILHNLANFSSLTSLLLEDCQLQGEFPAGIFKLPNLQFLSVKYNPDLIIYLPEFHTKSPLKKLRLGITNFSGEMTNSIGNLYLLNELDISGCIFSGSMLSSIGNLPQLLYLSLARSNFFGELPNSIGQLKSLNRLEMAGCNFSGPIPSWFGNQLTLLPSSFTNVTLPKFKSLNLNSCNLTEFPNFLKTQDQLVYLNLSNNRIQGPLPTWIWNMSTQTLDTLDLSHNFITGFHQPPPLVLPWDALYRLDFSSNMLQGSLLVPPSSISFYIVANNKLTGEIPLLICNASSLRVLDLSYNNLSGIIPRCLGSFADSLELLNLRNNKLHGPIPQTYNNGTGLRMINLIQNQLQGPVPNSLVNCPLLESLDLGNNKIYDVFPFWLGTLPELKVLILRFNRFHGAIWNPNSSLAFSKLHILDISHNGFTGNLPCDYFHTLTAMKTIDVNESTYIGRVTNFVNNGSTYALTLTNKGVQIVYLYILNIFAAIDLSSNQFEGEIPESIGILKCLHMLNLSNNSLIGQIPSSLRNLTEIESLDLSQNKLSGEIP